jgi:hypothetical protein
MRRLAVLVVAAVLVLAPAAAQGKGAIRMSVCGRDGCHRVPDPRAHDAVTAALLTQPPKGAAPFYALHVTMAEPDGTTSRFGPLRWLDEANLLRSEDESGRPAWSTPTAGAAAALRRAAKGLDRMPARRLGALTARPPAARVHEVVAPHAPARAAAGDPSPAPWLALGAGVLAAVAGAGAALRRRR